MFRSLKCLYFKNHPNMQISKSIQWANMQRLCIWEGIMVNSYPRHLVPKTTRTQNNSYPRQLVPKTTRTQDNSYPPRATRTQDNSYPRQFVPRPRATHAQRDSNPRQTAPRISLYRNNWYFSGWSENILKNVQKLTYGYDIFLYEMHFI